MKLSIVKVKGSCNWAIKAIVGSEVRYRGFYYKKDAFTNLVEWTDRDDSMRDFYHNFHTAETLRIKEL